MVGYEMKQWWVVVLLMVSLRAQHFVNAEPTVPCYFIFGDSLSDNGNNNDLNTLAKANYYPYGVDHPDGASGRFTNGKNVPDLLAESLGFEQPIPPFATAQDNMKGVNYASGSAGILRITGHHLGACISLEQQLQSHQVTISSMVEKLGNDSTLNHLNQCLYTVGMGSNDYINNYFDKENYNTSQMYQLDAYSELLIQEYSKQLRELYSQGARKIAIIGLGLIGCIPRFRPTDDGFGNGGCVEEMNKGATIFNNHLKSLVDDLNSELKDAHFIYINFYAMGQGDPRPLGFKVLSSPCCKLREDGQCKEGEVPCENRNEYIFWDSFHPTEASSRVTAARAYKAFLRSDTYPMDIHHLVKLDPQLSKPSS
ncbi:hypothetical protein K2173_006626 [Erythroxylum novogranatense]|uniref:GDSL esterase/lipase n=1 Tax=Erythroxylum novogranatense TaxID=1862640 RepID=A0AAV8T6U6_9ROSI|nr:hypothetical protein K2173_006626 [Erythroxylum novogranatense]